MRFFCILFEAETDLEYRVGLLTFSYSSKIYDYFYPQTVSPTLKKMLWNVLRGQCCSSSQEWQPSADSNGRLAHFFIFELAGLVWHPAADSNGRWACFKFEKKECQMAITICRGLSHPHRSLSRIVCRGQEGPKSSKGTLRPDFQANTRIKIFLKPQDTGRKL